MHYLYADGCVAIYEYATYKFIFNNIFYILFLIN